MTDPNRAIMNRVTTRRAPQWAWDHMDFVLSQTPEALPTALAIATASENLELTTLDREMVQE